jgi:hypothetical protein
MNIHSWAHVDWWFHIKISNVRYLGMVKATGLKNYGDYVTFNDMPSILNFMKICQLVQTL